MPKVMIQATEEWWQRWQTGLDGAIDTLNGLTAQITNHQINGEYDAKDLLDRLEGQLRDLRRSLEAFRIPF